MSVRQQTAPRLGMLYRARNNEFLVGLLFISPWIVGFAWFWLYPIASSIYYSFTSYNMMLPPIPVGFDNYTNLFHDDLFWQSLRNTAVYSLVSVPLDLIFAFVLALLLNQKIPGRAVFRAAFYFPTVVPSVATAILWTLLLSSQGGLVNATLGFFGIGSIPWLSSPSWAMPSLILLSLWTVGPAVVIFLAGLQDVPEALYEAARIDGAGYLRLVRHITLPMMSPVILFNLIIGIIAAFQIFATPFIMFSGGGPLNSALMYSVQLYTVAFKYFQMGYASAMAWILFALLFVLTLLSVRLSRRFVHYE